MNASASHGAAHRPYPGAYRTVRTVLLREFRSAVLNRYMQVFSVLALGGGFAAVALSEEKRAAAFFLLQVVLYFASLFALLAGVSSARAEVEEWPILFAQPIRRWALVLGKFFAATAIFSAVLALLFAPTFLTEGGPLGWLYLQTLGLTAVFGSVGLCCGILSADRVQGLIVSVSAWLFLLFGMDFVALLVAQSAWLQKHPDLWIALLMFNPLDAFRIYALFALEQIPPEAADKTPLARWWLTHAGLWCALVSTTWTVVLLFLSNRRMERSSI